MAVRRALGVTWRRLARQLITESGLLALAATVVVNVWIIRGVWRAVTQPLASARSRSSNVGWE